MTKSHRIICTSLALAAVLATAVRAYAQSAPPWGPGASPTEQNWLAFWSTKADVNGKVSSISGLAPTGSVSTDAANLTALMNSASAVTGLLGAGNFALPAETLTSALGGQGGTIPTILKRDASAATGSYLSITAPGVGLSGLKIDGNTSNANGDNNLTLNGFGGASFANVTAQNAVANAGWGTGYLLTSSVDLANGTQSIFDAANAIANQGNGATITAASSLTWENSLLSNNGGSGLTLVNGAIPSGVTDQYLKIIGNTFSNNGSNGEHIDSYNASAGAYGTQVGVNPVASDTIVALNHAFGNASYGLYNIIKHGIVIGNDEGGNATGGGNNESDLYLGQGLHIANLIHGGGGLIALEGGGATSSVFTNDYVYNNASSGINLGGSLDTTARNEFLTGNTGTADMQIFDPEDTGASFGGLPQLTTHLNASYNVIRLTTNSEVGVQVAGNAQASFHDNDVMLGANGTATNSCFLGSVQMANDNNRIINADGSWQQSINAATTTVIPDCGTEFQLAGSSVTVTNLYTTTQNEYANPAGPFYNGVLAVQFSTPYTGISNPSAVTVSFTGGTCPTQPVASATNYVNGNGTLYAAGVTNHGTCTSPVTGCNVSGGGAAGGTCTVIFGSAGNNRQRNILLQVNAGVTLASGGNLNLLNGISIAGPSYVRLRGDGAGNWNEMSISNPSLSMLRGTLFNALFTGTLTAPGSGQGSLGGNTANGAEYEGNGSTYDHTWFNNAGTRIFSTLAGTQNVSFNASVLSGLTGLSFGSLPSGTASTYACFTSAGALISSATAC